MKCKIFLLKVSINQSGNQWIPMHYGHFEPNKDKMNENCFKFSNKNVSMKNRLLSISMQNINSSRPSIDLK